MALKSLVTIDDATVKVTQMVIHQASDGSIVVSFSGTVNRENGTVLVLEPTTVPLTASQRTTVINFATNVGVPALKTQNGI